MIRLPRPCLVVLVGPSGSGKTHWTSEWFASGDVVSSDKLRALVGESEHDQRAGTDTFAVLDLVLERRMKRKLFTVVDTLGLDADRRAKYIAAARRRGVPVVAIVFDATPTECRARNTQRARPGAGQGAVHPTQAMAGGAATRSAMRTSTPSTPPGRSHVVDPQFVDRTGPRFGANRRNRCHSSSVCTGAVRVVGRRSRPTWASDWPPRCRPQRRRASRACG